MNRFELLKESVKTAGQTIRSMAPDAGIIDKEGRGNFVTAADLASEKILIDLITTHFPEDAILSEETESKFSSQELLSLDHLWVIDPIDGTNNFKNQRGYSAISVGYVEKGVIQAGAVYNFERDELFYTEAGKGATVNGKTIAIGEQTDLHQAVVATDPFYTPKETRRNLELLLKIEQTPFILMKGCASLMMCEIASGRTDLYFHTSVKPWDNAASFLIIKEAGGVTKGLHGEDITFLSPEIVAGNAQLVGQFTSLQEK